MQLPSLKDSIEMHHGEINDREFLFRLLLTISRELSVSNLMYFYFLFGHVDLPFNTDN